MAQAQAESDRWYFAYGRNLSLDRKRERTGNIRQAIRCRLPDFQFKFNKRGDGDRVYANIVPIRGETVWGVSYLCDATAVEALNRCEGFGLGHYRQLAVSVLTDNDELIEAFAYAANDAFVCQPAPPSPDYLNDILTGARQHRLPPDYISRVAAIAEGVA